MNDEIAVSVKNVYKNFRLPHEKVDSVKSIFAHPFKKRGNAETQHALEDISFEIKKGEFFGIVGRNGSGKSTLLKLIAGIYQPTEGSVHVNGRLVPFIELGVGFNPELTGRENVFLNGALMGFSNNEIKAKYDAIVDFAELERFMDQKLKNYSSGMQVRLAFSVATILAESDVLLIDEVLAVGDADFQRKCFNYFKKLKKEKKTVIFVSHDMGAIREYCDRVVLIDDGKVKTSGDTQEVARAYTQLFLNEEELAIATHQGKRWGDTKIQTKSVKLSTTDKLITIEQTIRANEVVEDPIIGIRVRSASGSEVLGTNSRIEGIKSGTWDVGVTRLVTWTFPNILSDGEYFLDPSIIDVNSHVYDWWDEASMFKVKKERSLPYPADPGFSIKIAK
ncbi:MAG: tagH [Candidatus Saccharibacteria bacterium]|nr:tagH [Candidatus Saccharibacteria bacterium]